MKTRWTLRGYGQSGRMRVAGLALLLAVPVTAAAIPAGARSVRSLRLQSASDLRRDARGGIGVAAATALRNGPLPASGSEYARGKAAAARSHSRTVRDAQVAPSTPSAPASLRSFAGLNDPNLTPSDSTSAIGATRFIELVNAQAAVYSRTGNTPLATGTLTSLTGAGAFDNVFDPQIIWDGQTRRFYYAADDVVSASSNLVAIGFSKTASPASFSSADWCQYTVNYGSDFPDYPKLGDNQGFFIVGVNVFTGNTFTGSDIMGISKPPAGTTCPAPSSFKFGLTPDVKTGTGAAAFTPVPAQQTDTAKTGWVVARPASVPGTGATTLTAFKIGVNTDGTPNIPSTGSDITVAAYKIPSNAVQKGATQLIDTSDTRLTQAVSAIDPGHANKVGLWTQHTVLGGAGAEVRWYEIDPAAASLLQSGKVTGTSVFRFNGAISPDRHVNGTVKQFGDSMVMVFNSSSSTTDAKIFIVSKIGAAAQSAPVLILSSPGPDKDFACAGGGSVCRWGDYAAATPDPASPTTGAHGQVWVTNQWNINSTSTAQSNWRTQNVVTQP